MSVRQAWIAVHQDADAIEETEVVFLTGIEAEPGATIEDTAGNRITLVEPAGEAREAA